MINKNVKQCVQQFVANDQGYTFTSSIKGTPAYWEKFKSECLAIVRQLAVPSFFLTLSCADLRWHELVSIITKLNFSDLNPADISNLSYHNRCDILNSNPVARHFQYRVELFVKLLVANGPLGKTKYYAIRVEFQVRGSPHIHSFIGIENAPKLTAGKIDMLWVDSIISAKLSDIDNDPQLHDLVKIYQIHRHSKTCRKYRNDKCRFHFGRYFTDRTIIAKPLVQSLSDLEKQTILTERKLLLTPVSEYINNKPRKTNSLDTSRDDYNEPLSIIDILTLLGISVTDYYNALSISDDNDYQIHLYRPPIVLLTIILKQDCYLGKLT